MIRSGSIVTFVAFILTFFHMILATLYRRINFSTFVTFQGDLVGLEHVIGKIILRFEIQIAFSTNLMGETM